MKNRPYNWSTKRLTKTAWTGLVCSQLYLLEIQAQLQKELDPNVGGGSGLLHMVCLVRNYTYTTTKNEGKVVTKEKQQR